MSRSFAGTRGLDPSTFVDVSVGAAGGGGYIQAVHQYETIELPNVAANPGGHYDPATSLYTVPSTALYLCLARVRFTDSEMAAGNFGLGIHTDNVAGPWFDWNPVIATLRGGVSYQRLGHFTAGDQLRLYGYHDSGQWITTAQMTIIRAA